MQEPRRKDFRHIYSNKKLLSQICQTVNKKKKQFSRKIVNGYKEVKQKPNKDIKRYVPFTVNQGHANLNNEKLFVNYDVVKNFILVISSEGKQAEN